MPANKAHKLQILFVLVWLGMLAFTIVDRTFFRPREPASYGDFIALETELNQMIKNTQALGEWKDVYKSFKTDHVLISANFLSQTVGVGSYDTIATELKKTDGKLNL